jgi:hypothetical protein
MQTADEWKQWLTDNHYLDGDNANIWNCYLQAYSDCVAQVPNDDSGDSGDSGDTGDDDSGDSGDSGESESSEA